MNKKYNTILEGYKFIINKNTERNFRIAKGLEAIQVYESIKKEERTIEIESLCYYINRELGSLFYETNCNYNESEKYFERSLMIKNNYKDIDSLLNECITKQMLCKEKLLLYLNTNNEIKKEEALELINFIKNNDIDKKIRKQIEELEEIYDSIEKKNIKTKVNFIIPYHLILDEENKIDFQYNKNKCSISSKTIRNPKTLIIDGNNIFTEKDKYGLLNHSVISIEINKYINPNKTIIVNKEIKNVYEPLNYAIDIYNYFIKKYIISTNKYWIPEINEKMIFNYEISVFAGKIKIKDIPLSISTEICFNNEKIRLKTDELEKIKNVLLDEEIELWKLSYNKAKDYYLIKDYKNSIIMINIALENFIYSYARIVLKKYKSDIEINQFLKGFEEYEDFYLKDFISKEAFEKAKEEKKIVDSAPSIYKICKELYNFEVINISKNQLFKKISIIKKYRNEIIHGENIDVNLKNIVEDSIKSFEDIFKKIKY